MSDPASTFPTMDAMTAGADIGAMLTGLSAVTAAYVWTRSQWNGWRQQRLARNRRTWHGYVALEGVDTWYVRVAADADRQAGQVVLEVLNGEDGTPDEMLAQGMRIVTGRDGMLSRSPTPEEFEFLKDLRKERAYGKGFPVRLSAVRLHRSIEYESVT
jgi:hypothetical protein